MSKQHPPTPTASAIGPCPTIIQIAGAPAMEIYQILQSIIAVYYCIVEYSLDSNCIVCTRLLVSYFIN